MERMEALFQFLGYTLEPGENVEEYVEESDYTENEFSEIGGNRTYLVLTKDEATEKAIEGVRESLWAFNAEFLANETGLPEEVFQALQPQCEAANDAITAIVERCVEGGIEEFAKAAISADGVAHLLNAYDDREEQVGDWFIYRTN